MDTFGQYLENISRWPLLTPAQEIELGRLKQAGIEVSERIGTCKPNRKESRAIKTGQRAVERMVLCNLRLVVSIAKNYIGHCSLHDIEDLVQYGSIGLKRAAERFDHEKGYKFSTYATWWIRQEIQRGIYKADRTIRLPEHCRLTWARLRKQNVLLTNKLGRTPTQDEVMEAAEVSKKDYLLLTRSMEKTFSLNAQLESGNELIENLTDPSSSNEISTDYALLLAFIETLREDDRDLIARRFGICGHHEHTLVELGDQRGVTRQRIKQKVDKIQDRIKTWLSVEGA
jgi:RNA polymerase primary sigma factor